MQNNDLTEMLKYDLKLLTERIEYKEKEIEDNNNTLEEMHIQSDNLKRYLNFIARTTKT